MANNNPHIDPSFTILKSSRLKVEIAKPGIPLSVIRFDLNGFVTQVTLDGTHTFCVPESYIPGVGCQGAGLCDEFNNLIFNGFKEGEEEVFPKLGVGLIKRQKDVSSGGFKPPEISALFPVELVTSTDQASYVVEPLDCKGCALREKKVFRVQDNQLFIDYTLENVGTRSALVHEYVHNFIGIDSRPVGPDYILSLPYPVDLDPATKNFKEPDVLRIEGNTFRFTRTPAPDLDFYCRPQGAIKQEQAQWELRNTTSGAGMREYDDFSPRYVAVWGKEHVISTEIFIEVTVEPGEKRTWSRRFEFFDWVVS